MSTNNTSEALPPLPEPFMRHWINEPLFEYVELFVAEQMHDYARAALAQRQQHRDARPEVCGRVP